MARSGQDPGQWYGKCLLSYLAKFCNSNLRAVSIVYRFTKTKVLTGHLRREGTGDDYVPYFSPK